MASAPAKSNALIMSMTSSATRQLSGALPCRSRVLALERGIEGHGERRLTADQRAPGQLASLALALRHQLEPLGADRQHVGLAVNLQFPLQRLVELCCHRR